MGDCGIVKRTVKLVGAAPSALHALCWHDGSCSHKTSSARYHLLLLNPVTTQLLLFQRCDVLSAIGTDQSIGMQGGAADVSCFSSFLQDQDAGGDQVLAVASGVLSALRVTHLPADKHPPPYILCRGNVTGTSFAC